MTLVTQSIGEFVLLLLLGSALVALTIAMLTDYRRFATRYLRRVRSFYERPRWRWSHPTTERQDRIGLLFASGLGLAMGVFILVVEMAALASGHVA